MGTDFSQKKDEDYRMSLAEIIDGISIVRQKANPTTMNQAASLRNAIAGLKDKVSKATLNITAQEKTDLVAHIQTLTDMASACSIFEQACLDFAKKETWDGS